MKFRAFSAQCLMLCTFALGLVLAESEQCGWQAGDTKCSDGLCCSKDGVCGLTGAHCGDGCQSQCHNLPVFIDSRTFHQMFPKQNDQQCTSQGFYSYEAFLKASLSFPNFAAVGEVETRKREIAAFLAHTAHETAGKPQSPPADQYVWGYCHLSGEKLKPNTCENHYPCPGQYYGRGPILLSGNVNYLRFGEFVGDDLIKKPDLLTTDAVASFKSAFWYWMTPEAGKPSCHEVITGEWQPTEDDKTKGWSTGFGLTTNLINGQDECSKGENKYGVDRIGYYSKFVELLGTTKGDNIDCYKQQPFVPQLAPPAPSALLLPLTI